MGKGIGFLTLPVSVFFMSILKWILGLGTLAVIVIVVLLILIVGLVALFFFSGTTGPSEPEGPNVFSDDNVIVVFPEWVSGDEGTSGLNDFFAFNLDDGRSYALNYLDEYSSSYEAFSSEESFCYSNVNCTVQSTQYYDNAEVICVETYTEGLGEVTRCKAFGSCNGKVFAVSVVQDLTYASLPESEFSAMANSIKCK